MTAIAPAAEPAPIAEFGPSCAACGGTGRIVQRTRLTKGGPVSFHERDCALCLGRGRTGWPCIT